MLKGRSLLWREVFCFLSPLKNELYGLLKGMRFTVEMRTLYPFACEQESSEWAEMRLEEQWTV